MDLHTLRLESYSSPPALISCAHPDASGPKQASEYTKGCVSSVWVQVTREVFEASKGRLKVVGRAGVGIDNVDLQAATEVSLDHGPCMDLSGGDALLLHAATKYPNKQLHESQS